MSDDRYRPLYPGRPGESLDDYLRRANTEFARAMEGNRTMIAIGPSVQDRANHSSDGRY